MVIEDCLSSLLKLEEHFESLGRWFQYICKRRVLHRTSGVPPGTGLCGSWLNTDRYLVGLVVVALLISIRFVCAQCIPGETSHVRRSRSHM